MWNLKFPNQGSSLHALHWKHGVLTTGPPGKSQEGLILLLNVESTCALRESRSWKCSPLARNYPPTHQILDPQPLPSKAPQIVLPKSISPGLRGRGDRQSECPDIFLKRVFGRVPGGHSLFDRQVTEDMALSPAASPPPEF